MKKIILGLLIAIAALPALAQNYKPSKYLAWLTSSDGGLTFQPVTAVLSGSPNYVPTEYAAIVCQATPGGPYQLCSGGGGVGTRSLSCQPGVGDGLNALPAGTYLQTTCRNETGGTWTLTAIRCVADSGSSTCNVTNGTSTALLTGAITGTSTYATGTQSGTTTIASGDFLKITFVADGTSKQVGIDVAGTY